MSGRTRPLGRIPGLLELADVQLGVVSRAQLAGLGVTRHHIRRQLEAQRWQLVGRRVVVLMTGTLTREQLWWAAALHAGPAAGLCAATALEVGGLRGWERDLRHVLVPHSTRVPPLDGVVLHQSRTFGAGDVAVLHGLPCTSMTRSALDAAAALDHPRAAAGLVVAVVQQRLTTADRLLAALEGRPGMRHVGVLRSTLADAAEGADSLREVDVTTLLRRAGLRSFRRQVVVATPDGPRRFDLGVELPDGTLLLLEVDGVHHLDPRQRAQDLSKDAAAIALGHRVLRVPVDALPSREHQLLAQLVTIRIEAERRAGRGYAS